MTHGAEAAGQVALQGLRRMPGGKDVFSSAQMPARHDATSPFLQDAVGDISVRNSKAYQAGQKVLLVPML